MTFCSALLTTETGGKCYKCMRSVVSCAYSRSALAQDERKILKRKDQLHHTKNEVICNVSPFNVAGLAQKDKGDNPFLTISSIVSLISNLTMRSPTVKLILYVSCHGIFPAVSYSTRMAEERNISRQLVCRLTSFYFVLVDSPNILRFISIHYVYTDFNANIQRLLMPS